MSSKVCIGQFVGSHGVRGLVKLRSFTGDPKAVAAYGPLSDESGHRTFRVRLTGALKDLWLAQVEGIATREQAQALGGLRLYVDRSALPDTGDEEEFYHADLIGLRAETVDGAFFGTVKAVHDYGGGDVLELVTESGAAELLAFTRACVPVVDVKGGRLVVDPPAVVEVRPGAESGADEDTDEDSAGVAEDGR